MYVTPLLYGNSILIFIGLFLYLNESTQHLILNIYIHICIYIYISAFKIFLLADILSYIHRYSASSPNKISDKPPKFQFFWSVQKKNRKGAAPISVICFPTIPHPHILVCLLMTCHMTLCWKLSSS